MQYSINLYFGLAYGAGLFNYCPIGRLFFAAMMRGYASRMENYMCSANEMNSSLVEYVNGIQVIKAFNRSSSSYGQYSKAVNYFHDCTMEWWRRVLAMECGRSCSPSLHLTWHASYRCFAFYEWFDYFTGSDDMSYCPPWLYRAAVKVSEAMEQVSMIKGNLEQVTAFLKTLNCSGLPEPGHAHRTDI